jgi:hypothetical protein
MAIHAKHVFGIQSGLFRTGKELARGYPLGSPCRFFIKKRVASHSLIFSIWGGKDPTPLSAPAKRAKVHNGQLQPDEPDSFTFLCRISGQPNIPSACFQRVLPLPQRKDLQQSSKQNLQQPLVAPPMKATHFCIQS